jgi:hypothetical protein
MGLGNILKTLVALYISVWLLLLKKLRTVYQCDHGNTNFGVFLTIVGFFRGSGFGKQPELKKTLSLPSIHRSTSIRERRRYLSDEATTGNGLVDNRVTRLDKSDFTHQQFVLRRRQLLDNHAQEYEDIKLNFSCKNSIITQAIEEKTRG